MSQTAEGGPKVGDPWKLACPAGREPTVGTLNAALAQLGLTPPRPVLILVGGAANLDQEVARRLLSLFIDLIPQLDRLGAAVIDGGTHCGVMALMGEARQRAEGRFPLLGIAPQGCVRAPAGIWSRLIDPLSPDPSPPRGQGGQDWPPQPEDEAQIPDNRAPLDPNHSHFLLVPGQRWGDESPWLTAAAAQLADRQGTLMLVAGGGAITWLDVEQRLRAGGRVLILAGSGGTADELAAGRYRFDGMKLAAGRFQSDDLELAAGPDRCDDLALAARTDRIAVMALAEAIDRLPQVLAGALAY